MKQTGEKEAKRQFWVQSADFTAKKFDQVELAIAKAVLAGYDWETELKLFEELLGEDRDHWHSCCCPGIGFHTDDETQLLHICPTLNKKGLCFYIKKEFPDEPEGEQWVLENANLNQISDLLELFFSENYSGLAELMDKRE